MSDERKTIIGILASHDSSGKNEALARVLNSVARDKRKREILSQFRFVFSGGTYRRLFEGKEMAGAEGGSRGYELEEETKKFLIGECGVILLPSSDRGGVTILAYLVTHRRVSILWPFLTPRTMHLYAPENLALLRLGDQWRVKKLMNTGSVWEWIEMEARRDARLNPQKIPLSLELAGSGLGSNTKESPEGLHVFANPSERPASLSGRSDLILGESMVALISHDDMKGRMLDFVMDYERELGNFKGILATGTTGRLVEESAPTLAGRVYKYHSGPKGGDIEIATEILFGGCQVIIFFVDPLRAHAHSDDIRVVFGACMIQDEVRMLSNEAQARDWMDRVVRGT